MKKEKEIKSIIFKTSINSFKISIKKTEFSKKRPFLKIKMLKLNK